MTRDLLVERAAAAYLGLAIGDALGATVEFMTPREIKSKYHVHADIVGGGWLNLKSGSVTDDTTMSLALGESIINHGGVEPLCCAEAFLQWMRNKPVDIGNTVRRGLVRYRKSGEPHGDFSEHDAGNGACMRTLPVALVSYGEDPQAIDIHNRAQAHVTHHNNQSDVAIRCVIDLIHMALAGEGLLTLLHQVARPMIEQYPQFHFRGRVHSNPSGFIVDTMHVVFQGLFDNNNFEETLIDVVNQGGDADTTGAIVGMIAGALYGFNAIPQRWLDQLDNEIKIQCMEQADELIKLSPGYQKLSV